MCARVCDLRGDRWCALTPDYYTKEGRMREAGVVFPFYPGHRPDRTTVVLPRTNRRASKAYMQLITYTNPGLTGAEQLHLHVVAVELVCSG